MKTQILFFILGVVMIPALMFGGNFVMAQTEIERLQSEIRERNSRLNAIEKEIAKYEEELKKVGAEKSTLQTAINQLELERKKVQADITLTENKIYSTDLTIDQLSIEIDKANTSIDKSVSAVAETLRRLAESDDDTLLEVFLRHSNLAAAWTELEELETVRQKMRDNVFELSNLKKHLEEKRGEETSYKNELVSLKNQYAGHQSVLDSNRKEKNQLLAETKNEEAAYQKQLAEQKAAKEKLLKEVQDIESQLQYILDPNSVPTKGTAVFRWPLDKIIITQYFGYTKFALQNQGVYKNNMHNGIDLGASTGTKIYAALGGTVRSIGNTDLVPGCYSWGQWVLIDHPNGLSTLYAHLSWTGVVNGQRVNTGDVIGYVGATGYATGPHLHFTVYASNAVQVKRFSEFKSTTSCGAALSPFSAVEGYLNPLDYLPSP